MESLPIADGALDGWISLNTVYFVEDLPTAFAELRRVLAPSGRGVLGIADPEWMAQQAFTKYTFTVRPVTDVVAALTAAGLSVEQRTMQGSAPSGSWFAARPDRSRTETGEASPGRSSASARYWPAPFSPPAPGARAST